MRTVRIDLNGRRIPRGRIVKSADGTLTWETQVREDRHLFRTKDAWTLTDTVLKQLIAYGVERIRLKVRDTGEIYEVELKTFLNEAEKLDQTGWKAHTERQFALPRDEWHLVSPAQPARQLALAL